MYLPLCLTVSRRAVGVVSQNICQSRSLEMAWWESLEVQRIVIFGVECSLYMTLQKRKAFPRAEQSMVSRV